MPKFSRFVAIALLISLMVSVAGSVFAQETYCLNLSAEDCDLYLELSESAEFPESAAFEMNLDGFVAGADMPNAVEFNVLATGAYIFDGEQAEAAVDEFGKLSVLDVSLGSILDLTDGVFSSLDAELNIALTLPPEMGGSAFGPFDLWLVEGVGYIDFTPFAAFTGDPNMTGVMGVDLFDFIEVPLSRVYMGDIFAEMEGMGDFDMSELDFSELGFEEGQNPFEAMFEQMTNPITEEDLLEFAKITRLPDETIDGVDVVVFQTTIDFASIFESQFMRDQIMRQMEMQGTDLPADLDMNEFMDALAEAMAGSVMTVTEKFEADSGFGIATTMFMDMTIDPAPIEDLMGGSSGDAPVEMEFTVDFTRSNINSVESINLPEDAQIIPVEMLLGETF